MTYRIGICDDEDLMLNINSIYIKNLAQKLNLSIELYTFNSGELLLDYSKSHTLDIVFLDIDLNGISGIKCAMSLRRLSPNIVTIFITGHTEYALEAFDADATGYLVKPINLDKLEHSIRRAVKYIHMSRNALVNKFITITENNLKIKIPQYQIIYFEKEGNLCKITTSNKIHYWYTTIKNVVDTLDDDFIQINQGVVVNIRYVKNLIRGEIILKNGNTFKIGRQYLATVKDKVFAN
jgi:DNA-binding LytR/AlgR family response regulator